MIIQHMKSDPNALKHAEAGLYTFIVAVLILVVIDVNPLLALIAPFITGVGIEVYQKLYRSMRGGKFIGFAHAGQNTFKENVLDTMQTGLFYVTFWVNRGL